MINAIMRLATAFAICSGVAVYPAVGDGNSAAVLQISPPGSSNGNVLILDQSAATGSTFAGMPLSGALTPGGQITTAGQFPALQMGEGNRADVTLTGAGAVARLLQSTSGSAMLGSNDGNRASILAKSATSVSLIQLGLSNAASLTLDARATALVSQIGNNNLVSDLNVGSGGEAVVTQTGNDNSTGAIVVPPGVALNYAQTGNGLGPLNGAGVQILYSGAPAGIAITQRGW